MSKDWSSLMVKLAEVMKMAETCGKPIIIPNQVRCEGTTATWEVGDFLTYDEATKQWATVDMKKLPDILPEPIFELPRFYLGPN